MKNNKGLIITISVLVICVLVETILLITGAFSKVPKNANGEDIMISLNDGTNYTVNDVYSKVKETSYFLSDMIDMIDNHILGKEYENKKSDLEKEVANQKANLIANYGSESAALEALQNYGYNTIDEYLDLVRINTLKNYASTDYAKSLVTDQEAKDYYDNTLKADMAGVHILVKPTSNSTEDLDKAKAKAEEVIKAINEDVKNGTDIKEAFKKYENDESVVYQDLGRFNYATMDEAFSKAAYDLKVNEMSSTPVKSSFGYHLILKTEEFEKEKYEDKVDSIKETLAKEKTSDDTTIKSKAIVNLRNKYGLTINDSTIKTYYDRTVNRELNPTTTTTAKK